MDTLLNAVETATNETTPVVVVPEAPKGFQVNPNLKLVANEDNGGAFVTPFEDTPDRAWVMFEEVTSGVKRTMGGLRSQIVVDRKTVLLSGPTGELETRVKIWKKGITGRICTIEHLESTLPEEVKDMDAESLDKYAKRAGSVEDGGTGIECTKDGEQIYMFRHWDDSGLEEDILIPHDNGKIIREASREAFQSAREARAEARRASAPVLP